MGEEPEWTLLSEGLRLRRTLSGGRL